MLKKNRNAETSLFRLKGCPKSCKMRPKSIKSAEPFLRYSTLKIKTWTALQEKSTEKLTMLSLRCSAQTKEQLDVRKGILSFLQDRSSYLTLLTGICTSKHTQNLLFHKISKTRFWWKLFILLYTPSWHNFFLQCLKYIRQKDSLLFFVKVFNFFRYVPQNIHWHFQSYF